MQLLKMLVTNPNFLILDEPTNDFDIDTLNVLEEFLEKFTGCLLLVSHDRYFMDHLVDQLFVFEGEGKIRFFNGNYTDYRDWLDESKPEQIIQQVSKPVHESAVSIKRKVTYKEKQEYEKLQSEISELEKQKKEIEVLLNSGITDHVKLHEFGVQLIKIDKSLEEKTLRWMELAEVIESD